MILSTRIFAQNIADASCDPKVAKQFFQFGDYNTSLKEYQCLFAEDSLNPEYALNLAICYLKTNVNQSKAYKILEQLVSLEKVDPEAYYYLGMACAHALKFEDAIAYFEKFEASLKGNDWHLIPANRYVEMCDNAIQLIKTPVNVVIESLGNAVNTTSDEYYPFIEQNETALYYNSKRTGNLGGQVDFDGLPMADIFYIEKKQSCWDKAKRMTSPINSAYADEITGLTPDGKQLILNAVEYDGFTYAKYAQKTGKSFQALKPLVLPNALNLSTACFSPDKKTLIFSKPAAKDDYNTDLYMTRLLPSGNWSEPTNLGKNINSNNREDFPYISPDGKKLYFASEGHNSMGKLDIFVSEWNEETQSYDEATNLGYPVNTADDNTTISFTKSGRYAYVSRNSGEGNGNLDIYRIVFKDVKPPSVILKGTIVANDSSDFFEVYNKKVRNSADSITLLLTPESIAANQWSDADMDKAKKALQLLNDKLNSGVDVKVTVSTRGGVFVGLYRPNKANSRFIALLTPGSYKIEISANGNFLSSENIEIADQEYLSNEIVRNFKIKMK
jgi:Tol biopolymer transport system component